MQYHQVTIPAFLDEHWESTRLQYFALTSPSIIIFMCIPAGTSKNDPSGDHFNLRKKDGNVSSWNRWLFTDCTLKNCETSYV